MKSTPWYAIGVERTPRLADFKNIISRRTSMHPRDDIKSSTIEGVGTSLCNVL